MGMKGRTKKSICHYHLCRRPGAVIRCQYCQRFYCSEHIQPKPPSFYPLGDFSSSLDVATWRMKGHPDAEYALAQERAKAEEEKRYEEVLKALTSRKAQKLENENSESVENSPKSGAVSEQPIRTEHSRGQNSIALPKSLILLAITVGLLAIAVVVTV